MKRIFIGSDLHCGHLSGLTPPEWQYVPEWKELQAELWSWFAATVAGVGPFDVAVWNGDLIDGRGERSGGTELITTDRRDQCDIAIAAIRQVDAATNVLTYGTPYHAGTDEDWEAHIAREVGGTIGGHEWVDVNGLVFDCEHKVGSSQIPHGRYTAVARENVWNLFWAEKDFAPRARVIIRSHVHYHAYCGTPQFLGMTTPALQGPGSKYGVRQCSGVVDFGFITFEVDDHGRYGWASHILQVSGTKPEPIKV
jgi:hypothetical protein